jgi:tRNA A-37 threonylcarbamoyl transferase component Bud32
MFQSGQQIGNYTLVKKLGSGSFGEVWMALRRAKFVTTRVAVKLPLKEIIDHDDVKHEAVVWEKASGHPNVLPIIEADEYDDQIVIVSEFAPDGSLEDRLQTEESMPVKQVVETAIGIAQGLKFLHSRRIIHRDIKPANILLQGDTPRLTDFGLSRLWMGNSMSMEVSGTPFYMAPEAFGRKRNEQTDVWSFGVVIYEMLTGRMPFVGDDVAELYASVLNEEPRPMPDEIPPFLQEIVRKALEKSPAARYANMAEILDDLQNCLLEISGGELSGRALRSSANNSFARSTADPMTSAARRSRETLLKSTAASPAPDHELGRNPAKRRFFKLKYFAAAGLLLILAAFGTAFFIARGRQPIPFRKGDKFGYSTWGKEIVIGPRYDLATPFSENLGLVGIRGQSQTEPPVAKYGFLDMAGREVIALEYDYAESFANERAKVGKLDPATGKMRFGFIDAGGALKIPPDYEDAQSFSENLAAVKSAGKWGFIDKNGNQIVPFEYESVGRFADRLAAVKTGDKYGFINNMGAVVIAPVYELAGDFADGAAPVEQNGKAFFIDANGRESIRLKYDRASVFAEGLAMVTRNGKAGFIGRDGVEVVAFQFEDERSVFSEGLADVKLNGKKGFINRGGKAVIDFKYAATTSFKNHLARVKTDDGKEFYIGSDGTEFYEP